MKNCDILSVNITIADLYDPETMPADPRAAHDRNDETLERIYIGRRFKNDRTAGKAVRNVYPDDHEGADMIEALIGLVGVVIGSGITIWKDVWNSKLERRRDGSFSAIRLICILEDYADKCISIVGDDGTAYGRPAGRTKDGEEYYEAQETSPEPPVFPDDIAWRSITEPLMHRALALPNVARSTDRHISAASENASPPFYDKFFETRQEGYARLGLEALNIADDLRQQFGVSAMGRAKLSFDWDPKKHLREKLLKFDERHAEISALAKDIFSRSSEI
jgi:hypothetical protein